MPGWNLSVVFDSIARDVPTRDALVQGSHHTTWGEFAARARGLASYLQTEAGLTSGDKVALFLPNRAEYLEAFYAVRKLQCAALNISTESSVDTLNKVVDGSDAKVVVHAPEATEIAFDATRRIQKRWRPVLLSLGDPYERAVAESVPPADWDLEVPSADDLIFIATRETGSAPTTMLPAAPFAYGNGLATALGTLTDRGTVVFADAPHFDADLVWRTVARTRVETVTIAGDKYAGPLLASLQRNRHELDLGSLRTISSAGAQLSDEVVRALETELPSITVLDTYEAPATPQAGRTAKVQPAEVEARLRKHKSVFDCAVVGVSDPRVGKHVVALIQVVDNHYIDEPELAAWCRAHLPSTRTPGRFVFVDAIEHTPDGTIDYDRMRHLALDRLVGEL